MKTTKERRTIARSHYEKQGNWDALEIYDDFDELEAQLSDLKRRHKDALFQMELNDENLKGRGIEPIYCVSKAGREFIRDTETPLVAASEVERVKLEALEASEFYHDDLLQRKVAEAEKESSSKMEKRIDAAVKAKRIEVKRLKAELESCKAQMACFRKAIVYGRHALNITETKKEAECAKILEDARSEGDRIMKQYLTPPDAP